MSFMCCVSKCLHYSLLSSVLVTPQKQENSHITTVPVCGVCYTKDMVLIWSKETLQFHPFTPTAVSSIGKPRQNVILSSFLSAVDVVSFQELFFEMMIKVIQLFFWTFCIYECTK